MFSVFEKEILLHRLNVPKCIAENLADEFSEDDVYDVCMRFIDNNLKIEKPLSELEFDVLDNCVWASTYVECAAQEYWEQPGKLSAVKRAMAKLEIKIMGLRPNS